MKLRALLLIVCLGVTSFAARAEQTYDYHLQPRNIAADTWVIQGRNEEFSLKNGGNIVNTAFIVTGAGVVVIDTGPSREYGEEMVKAIAKVTQEPIVRVFNTHHHPDHFLGNQAFAHDLLEALPETIASLGREGNALTERMYQMAGDWMKGTEPVIPQWEASPGDFTIGRHKFRLMSLHGHTGADMALLDTETGVLFAADLVFNGRAPTTPHAQVDAWLKSLDQLEQIKFKILVPGHGDVVTDAAPIRQTRAWLQWLTKRMYDSANAGLDMTELLALPLPDEFHDIAVAKAEYPRSVGHLYPAAEAQAFRGKKP